MGKFIFDTNDKEWDAVLETLRHDYCHTRKYHDVEAKRLGGHAYALYISSDEGAFFLPFIVRSLPNDVKPENESWYDATSAYGYPCPLIKYIHHDNKALIFNEFVPETIKELKNFNIISIFIRLHPLFMNFFYPDQKSLGCFLFHGETVWIDLSLPEEELQGQMRSTTRNEIRKMIREGYTVRIGARSDDINIFNMMYEQTMKRLNADKWYYFGEKYFDDLATALGESLNICVVEKDGVPCCAGLFTATCNIVQYLLSGTADKFTRQPVTKLMLHQVRVWAKERGYSVFHLGGGLGAKADSLFDFKASFSKLRAEFYTWRMICDESKFLYACKQWEIINKKPINSAGDYFPPYRAIPPD